MSGDVFPIGTTTVTCKATDKAGNTGDSSFTVTVQDTTAPTVSVPADITQEATSAAGATATFALGHDAVDGAVAHECTPASGSTFGARQTTVICSATDDAGNTGTGCFTVTVRDTTAPRVTVPADLVAEATGPNGAKVVYGDVSAIDIVDGPVNPPCTKTSNTVFPLGTTTVTCTATDAAGNTGSDSFTVKVVGHHAPAVPDPRQPGGRATTRRPGRRVVYSGASADDLVDGDLPVTCTPASGGAFPLGTTTVTCTAKDKAGNIGEGTFTVEVQDETKPPSACRPTSSRRRPGRTVRPSPTWASPPPTTSTGR